MRGILRHNCILMVFALVLCVLAAPMAASGESPLSFDSSFVPGTISPGGVATLQFNISNNLAVPDKNLAFINNLPAGVVIASPANMVNECEGTVSAPDGGTTISLTGGDVDASASCLILVDMTSSTPGTHTNVTGDLTSDAGNSGPASADLTIATDRPGFTKSFSPASVPFGGHSTLTLTIDNTANSNPAYYLTFTDNLPDGMEIADPAIASTDCPGILTAPAGGSVISLIPDFQAPPLAAWGSCSVSVDVIGNAVGLLGNTTGELTSGSPTSPTVSSGKASAVLEVTLEELSLIKRFTNDPVYPGGNVTLEFTVLNRNRNSQAVDITFKDDLEAFLSGLTVNGTLPTNPCGPGSSLTGTDTLTLTGGNLAPEGNCTFEVELSVPTGVSGTFLNETNAITASVNGESVTGNAATDILVVTPAPTLTKTFIGDPVGAGGTVELEFTITNPGESEMTDIAFTDELTTFLPFPVSVTLPTEPCGTGSSLSLISLGTDRQGLSLTGGSLASGGSCTFSVLIDITVGLAGATYTNTTSEISAVVGNETVIGPPASDDLVIVAAPRLSKEFTDDPVPAGDTVTLAFTLSHGEEAFGDATGIIFSDDLNAALPGLLALGLPANNVCGPGSQLAGTSTVTLTGGTLSPGEDCTFSFTLQVPEGAPAGAHTNTTSQVVAAVGGIQANAPTASDDLRVAGLALTHDFTDDPVIPGGTVTLRYTLENKSTTSDATNILFTHNLDEVVDGLSATVLPLNDICGIGSSLTGTLGDTFLTFQGGSLAAGESCTFDVVLQVPGLAVPDIYNSVTSLLSSSAELNVSSDFSILMIEKEFIDDPVAPGNPVTLRFTLSNLSTTDPVTDIAFTDDLEAALSGLVSLSGTQAGVCGVNSEISGTNLLSFTGGSLAASASCTFDVQLTVPSAVLPCTVAFNETSPVTGDINGVPVTGDPARDELRIGTILFSKSFNGPVYAGETVVLSFTIENQSADTASDLSFSDNLEAMIPGLTAIGLPLFDICGVGSLLDGTSKLAFSGGSIPPKGSCTFSVTLQVPLSTGAGKYFNTTSELRQFNNPLLDEPATATLEVLVSEDADNDGVPDPLDICPGTVIPEGVPTVRLGINSYALVDQDWVFDTTQGKGKGPRESFDTTDTGGCSCEQIIEKMELGKGHTKFGCSIGAMREWIEAIKSSGSE